MRYNSICVPILFLFKKKKEKERVQILIFFFSRKIFKKYKRHKDLQYGIEIMKQKTVWYNEFANKEDKNHYLHFKLSPAPPDSYLHHTKLIFSTSSLNKIVTWSKNSIIYIYIKKFSYFTTHIPNHFCSKYNHNFVYHCWHYIAITSMLIIWDNLTQCNNHHWIYLKYY